MVLTTSNPPIGDSAPAQARAVYQPIELPVTATMSTSWMARKSRQGGGIDQRAGIVAAAVAGKAVGACIKGGQGFLPQCRAGLIEGGDQRRVAMPGKCSDFGRVIGATSGADDNGGFHGIAAATMLSADGMVAA